MHEILSLISTSDSRWDEFFNHYIETRNEITALARAEVPYAEYLKYKKTEEYKEAKAILKDFFVNNIEAKMYELADTGEFKSCQFILQTQSPSYAKNKKEDSTEMTAEETVEDVLRSIGIEEN